MTDTLVDLLSHYRKSLLTQLGQALGFLFCLNIIKEIGKHKKVSQSSEIMSVPW